MQFHYYSHTPHVKCSKGSVFQIFVLSTDMVTYIFFNNANSNVSKGIKSKRNNKSISDSEISPLPLIQSSWLFSG